MKWLKKWKKNEEGSATIEFIGMIPLVFLVLVIVWQLIVSAHAVMVAQSAANEYAKVLSVTQNQGEAEQAGRKITETAGALHSTSFSVSGDKEFSVSVNSNIALVFLPAEIFGSRLSIPVSTDASGRVIE